jgi:hypothetical protein
MSESTYRLFSQRYPSHIGHMALGLVMCAASSACSRAIPELPTVDDLHLAGVTLSIPRVNCLDPVDQRQSTQPKATVRRRVDSVGFVFYLPSLERCDGPRSTENFHEDRVLFTVQASIPDQAGRQPHADIDGALERLAGVTFVPGPTTDLDGLTCFPLPPNRRVQQCMGIRGNGERFLISVPRAPHEDWMKFPSAQTSYFSRELGGVQILWRVHVKHISKWRQIDAHAWEMLRSWEATSRRQQGTTRASK